MIHNFRVCLSCDQYTKNQSYARTREKTFSFGQFIWIVLVSKKRAKSNFRKCKVRVPCDFLCTVTSEDGQRVLANQSKQTCLFHQSGANIYQIVNRLAWTNFHALATGSIKFALRTDWFTSFTLLWLAYMDMPDYYTVLRFWLYNACYKTALS